MYIVIKVIYKHCTHTESHRSTYSQVILLRSGLPPATNGSINALSLSNNLISSLFTYFASTNSGYFYINGTIGNRLLIQWGFESAANITLTFTLPYSTAPSVIAVGNGGDNGSGGSNLHTQSICVYNVTTTNCIVGQFTLNDPFYWIAVGIF